MTTTVIDPLGEVYIGRQAVFGTPVARTHAIRGQRREFNSVETWESYAGYKGFPTLAPSPEPPVLTYEINNVINNGPLDANEIILALTSGLQDNPAITTPAGGTNSRQWLWLTRHDRTPSIDPYTVEWIERNADSGTGRRVVIASDMFCTEWGFTSSGRNLAQMSANYTAAIRTDPGAFTAGISADESAPFPASMSVVGIYDTMAAAIAGAPVASDVYSVSGRCTTGWVIRDRAAGVRTYEQVDGGPHPVQLTLSLYVSTGGGSIEREEQVHKRSGDLRFVRIDYTSPREIETGFPYSVSFIFAMRHTAASMISRGAFDSAGRGTIDAVLETARDATSNNDIRIAVVTDKLAYP